MKGEGLIFLGLCLFIGYYLFPDVRFPPALTVVWRSPGRVSHLLRRGKGPLNLAAVVVELGGVALAIVGLAELASPGVIARFFGYDYVAFALVVGLVVLLAWVILAAWRVRHREG